MIMSVCAPEQAEPTLEHTLVEGSGLHLPLYLLAPIISFENASTGFAGIFRIIHTIAWNHFTEFTVRLFGWETI